MIDIKFVIKGLEDAKDVIRKSEITGSKKVRLIDACCNAVTLLKEQEAKQVKTDMYGNFYCPWCSTDRIVEMGAMKLHIGTRYCPYCGQKVTWNA